MSEHAVRAIRRARAAHTPREIRAMTIQSLVHISFVQTDAAVSVRFSFFFAQFLCMTAMGVHIALAA